MELPTVRHTLQHSRRDVRCDVLENRDPLVRIAQQKLAELFAIARECFFPRWDPRGEWEIVAKRCEATGYCQLKEKRIYVDPNQATFMLEDGLLALIIHEICHDVATAFHTERWVERMEKAAQKAESLERPELACQIRASAYSHIPVGKPWREKWCHYLYHLIHED